MARHRSGSPGRRAADAATPPSPSVALPATSPGPARHRHDPATTPLDLAAIATAAAATRARTGRRGSVATAPPPAPTHDATAVAPLIPGQASAPSVSGGLPAQPATGQHAAQPATGALSARTATGVPPAALPTTGAVATPDGRATHRAGRAIGAALGRVVSPTRAAGALALVGALAGAGVAAASGGSTLTADPAADTGSLPQAEPSGAEPSNPATAGVVTADPSRTSSTPSPSPRTASTRPAAPVETQAVRPVDDGRTLWSADFARAGLANFKSTPWNMQGAKAPSLAGGALDFAMPGGGKRAEVEPDFKDLREGDEYFFGFTVALDRDFPVNASGWQVITQFKNAGTGSPPLEVTVKDGKFVLDGDSGGFSQVIGDAVPGRSTHLALRVRFSASNGSVSAWQDGAQKIADFRPPSGTMYAGKPSYVKTGLYRDTGIDEPGRLRFSSWAIGTSLGAVSREAAAPPRD